MLRKLVREILRRFGIVAFRRSSGIFVPEEESYRIVSRLVERVAPIIIDGGAHRGGAVDALSRFFPGATFHCFEPDPTLGMELSRRFASRQRVHVVRAALGERAGKAQLNINASRPTNSLLPASESLQPDLKALSQLVERVEVDIVTIDEYCRANAIDSVDVVKLDLQGFDYRALLGAAEILASAKVVVVEVLFMEIYKGCHLFPDVLKLMLDNGFELYTLCGLHYGADDELLWADAVFLRSDGRRTTAGGSIG
jgi:FkbM family methyltransferase